MLVFPNSKINIGLNIVKKRSDGFHNLETVFYPINLTDILEFTENKKETTFTETGIAIDSKPENNLVLKAYNLLKTKYKLPDIHIHLHKIIPAGAGLGGGSSNAAYMLTALNDYFDLKINDLELENLAQDLGSDCPFFIKNTAVYAEGTGNIFSDVSIDLSHLFILIVKPDIHISTKDAFSGIEAKVPNTSLKDSISGPIETWKDHIKNDFEESVFKRSPETAKIRESLYDLGAIYSQMSGSGASVFGIYDFKPTIPKEFEKYFIYIQKPNN